jgi:RecA/RadA recombinase
MKTSDIKKMLKQKKPKREAKQYLSTGSTMLNLACSGKPNGGFLKGLYYYLVGDSASGKTFLSLTCLAEAANNKNFDNYRFIYDNSENGALMSIEQFFGKKVMNRMEPPKMSKTGPVFSSTIEEFYYHIDDAIQKGTPFIYILDSMDSLTSKAEISKFNEKKTAHRKGKDTTGSYGDGKAKVNSEYMRKLMTPLKKSESILIVISQTRDNLGFGFEKKSRAGGHALRFYACMEIWSSIRGQLSKTVKGKPRQIGIACKLQVKKNRQTGAIRSVETPIYHSYGIDDIGACVDFVVEEGHWSTIAEKDEAGKKIKGGSAIKASEFEYEGKREALIKHIETEGLEKDLRSIVGDVWSEIEEACTVKRKRRYL